MSSSVSDSCGDSGDELESRDDRGSDPASTSDGSGSEDGQTSSSNAGGGSESDERGSDSDGSDEVSQCIQDVSVEDTHHESSGDDGDEGDGSGSSSDESSDHAKRLKSATEVAPCEEELETTAEHIEKHKGLPKEQRRCSRCQFIKQQSKLQSTCTWVDPLGGQKCTWLMVAPGVETKQTPWGLGCSLCRWAKTGGVFAQCQKKSDQT